MTKAFQKLDFYWLIPIIIQKKQKKMSYGFYSFYPQVAFFIFSIIELLLAFSKGLGCLLLLGTMNKYNNEPLLLKTVKEIIFLIYLMLM